MEISEAQKIVARERARWFSFARKLSDDALLRRHERLFNGFAMLFALATLPTWFFGGPLGIVGVVLAIGGEVVAARHCSGVGNQCRGVREILKSQLHESSA